MGKFIIFPDNADSINSSLVTVTFLTNKTGAVHIKWQDPLKPNGLILTYDIEYMNQNIKNVSFTAEFFPSILLQCGVIRCLI